MCTHNGTHVDAPRHFINRGKTIDELPLNALIGMAYVCDHSGIVDRNIAECIIETANQLDPESAKRILIKGNAEVSLEAAKVFVKHGVWLVGNESQTIGPEDSPMAVHLELLSADVVLLEGIRLSEVREGVYLLNAAPLNLAGAEGSPCRAVLIDLV
jgi:arylformamidase